MYCGLIASSYIFLLLPWKYAITGKGVYNFPSKMNLMLQYMFMIMLPLMLMSSFHRHYKVQSMIKSKVSKEWPSEGGGSTMKTSYIRFSFFLKILTTLSLS